MDRLWSPWRSEYIAAGGSDASCVFCRINASSGQDETNFVLHRGAYNYVVLNLYPYVSGHLLIVPYDHVGSLAAVAKPTTDELMDLTKRAQTALGEAYKPTGYNIGMNLGMSAGAGVVDHIHIHILPRWVGDTNFMSTVAETRVIPEDLSTTYRRLRDKF